MSSGEVVVMHETRRFHKCTNICRGMQDCQTGVRLRPSYPDFEQLGSVGNFVMASVKRTREAVASTVVWSHWAHAKHRLFVRTQ